MGQAGMGSQSLSRVGHLCEGGGTVAASGGWVCMGRMTQ